MVVLEMRGCRRFVLYSFFYLGRESRGDGVSKFSYLGFFFGEEGLVFCGWMVFVFAFRFIAVGC